MRASTTSAWTHSSRPLYPTIPTDADEWSARLALRHVEGAVAEFEKWGVTTRHLWLGNGVDHQEAQPHTPELIRLVNARQKRVRLVHSTYERLMNAVRAEAKRLPEIHGQFRLGLEGTMTSRVYLKQSYARIGTRIEALAEPLLAVTDRFGRGHRAFREPWHNAYTFNSGQNWASFPEHPAAQLTSLWKLLLRNSPHDDLCGCSVDATHQDMENRFKRASEITEYLVKDSTLILASRFAARRPDGNLPVVAAFNPHAFATVERVRAKVFVRGLSDGRGLRAVDSSGAAVPLVVDSARRIEKCLFDGNDFTIGPVAGMEIEFSVQADMPPCGFRAFALEEGPGAARQRMRRTASVKTSEGAVVIDNAFQRVTLHRDATFDIYDKATRRTYRGLGALEDVEDAGDEYKHRRFKRSSRPVTCERVRARLRILSHDAISTRVAAEFGLRLPKSLSPGGESRSRATVPCPVCVVWEIPHFRPGGRIALSIDNRAKDHELYLGFPTGIDARRFEFDSKFDYDSYAIGEPVARIDSLALVRDRSRGTAIGIVGDCPTLVQSRAGKRGAEILMSVVRCVDRVTSSIPYEYWPADEGQCLRRITRRFEWVTGRCESVRSACLERRRTKAGPSAFSFAIRPKEIVTLRIELAPAPMATKIIRRHD